MDPVVHFEMPYDDRQRMMSFYNKAFGWQTQVLGEEYGNYVMAMTAESDECGPKKPGMINGGFYGRCEEMPEAKHPTIVIAVQNIGDAMQKIRDAGGKVLGDPMPIPNVGSYVSFIDTEGNRVSVLEPVPEMKNK
ncbi:MAG TPA: VOC family protein [Burkholderiales bacterium]|nr:VOC family protein [Burkholderiales bacterium]